MKNVLYILNDGVRKFTYARTAGLYRALRRAPEPINLFIVRSEGHAGFAPNHNCGEYNIFRLPDYSDFDGVFLDINSNFSADSDTAGARGILCAVQAAAASGKPVISMANDLPGFYYVGIDNHAAMTSVIRYLHQDMHLTDFWFVMGPRDNYENITRTRALRDYCLENGLPCQNSRFYAESFNEDCGVHGFGELCGRHGGALPQAIVCANDAIASGVLKSAQAAGYDIPGDCMLTGFDNLELSAFLSPSITTLDQLCWTMGDYCVDTMCRIWRGEAVPRMIYTPTELVLRESTGHPDSEKSYYKAHAGKLVGLEAETEALSYTLSVMQYQLPSCESLEEICNTLIRCLSALGCRGARMVLDRELFEYTGSSAGQRQTERALDISELLPTEDYADTMEQVLFWEYGKQPQFGGRAVGSALPVADYGGMGEDYLFIPLHFMEYTVGYLSLWKCVELLRLKCVSAIVNPLTMALRSYFTRKKLSCFNEMLSGLSMQDDLTGLYNRLGYHNLAHRLFKRTCDEGRRLAVLFVDVDRLKHINDTWGHAAGDHAIASVAEAIRQCAPEGTVPVRYGGDEFVVFLPMDSAEDVEKLIEAIRHAIPEAAGRRGVPLTPGISTGYVLSSPQSPKTLDQYVQEADNLMYIEKKRRKQERGDL